MQNESVTTNTFQSQQHKNVCNVHLNSSQKVDNFWAWRCCSKKFL